MSMSWLDVVILISFLLSVGVAYGVGLRVNKKNSDEMMRLAEERAETIEKEAELKAKTVLIESKTSCEKEVVEKRKELQLLEKRILQKEDNLDKKMSQFETKEQELKSKEQSLQSREQNLTAKNDEVKRLIEAQGEKLEEISGMTTEQAKNELMLKFEQEVKHDMAKQIKLLEEEARSIADKKSKEIISSAIQRYAGEYVAEKTVSVVSLPSDEMKGRIIGREGRNIRALEAATGVDLIIDDTPEAVILSSFNPVRREIAKISLEKLISDGRIHPGRIEEVVNKSTEEVEQAIKEAGERAAFDLGVHGIHPEILKLIGRLKYRTSYTQNIYQHSLEVAFICGIMAAELGLNVKQAKRAGLLHDLGKAVDHEIEGSHAVIGADLAKKYGESAKIVHAIRAHHEDEKPSTPLAVLVQAADALSGARPGARREMMETYIKRLADLERIATSFDGVIGSFAIQAGREIRVMVSSETISDDSSIVMARDIAKKIESEMAYPGQIKVNVIRETRAVEYAR